MRALYTGKYGNWGHWLKDKLATGIDSLVFLKLPKNVWSTLFLSMQLSEDVEDA